MTDWSLPTGPFTTVVADPPWRFRGAGRLGQQAKRRPVGTDFPMLTVAELCSIPVREVVAERAHLYLWVTSKMLEPAFEIARAWGFEPMLQLVWVKRRPDGPLQIGMGRHFRRSHELVLFAVRGHLLTRERNVSTVFEAPNPRHGGVTVLARKPPEFYELVERQSPAPYLELFSRNTRKGWTMWGDEVGKFGATERSD